MFTTRLSVIIQSKLNLTQNSNISTESDDKSKESKRIIDQTLIYQSFDLNVLLVLDNTEDLLENDNSAFVTELNALLDNCRNLKFLITTRKTINNLSHNAECPYTLQPLTKQESLKLLISKSPRLINDEELKALLQCDIPPKCSILQSLNIKQNKSKNMTLLDHPLTTLLGGHPHTIALSAPLLEYKSLKELFYDF